MNPNEKRFLTGVAKAALMGAGCAPASAHLLSRLVIDHLHVRDGRVVVVDPDTGRLRFGRHGAPMTLANLVSELRQIPAFDRGGWPRRRPGVREEGGKIHV